jgi:digeranylgeranylglycerophospholipid reductase
LTTNFDFVVAGGSVAGLAFAAEAAKRGATVLVAEEHQEIGEPEKCDGLVSLRGLRKFGYEPEPGVVQSSINAAVIHSPSGRSFAVNASHLEVVVLDRSEFDKQIAATAASTGAVIRTGVRANRPVEKPEGVETELGGDVVGAKYFVDATGPASSPKRGILPAAKYELEGDWVREHVVELFMDAEKYPGFFAWVIPFGGNKAKVGAAGRGISPFKALDAFLAGRRSTILRRVSAPIYVGGPAPRFVEGRRVLVGESAGQVKPTTAGGITTSLAGAVTAARWICGSLGNEDPELVPKYQKEWETIFSKEMKTMLKLRGVLEKLSNPDMEAVFTAIATPRIVSRMSRSDFDYHATALLGALGLQGLLRLAKVVASAEVRSLLVES